jgi:hypothetical protein
MVFSTLVGGCTGCTTILISPYDVDIDHGMEDVKQKLNVLVADAASHAGTDAGTYDAYLKQYSDIEVQLAALRSRASMDEIDDVQCSVPEKLRKSFSKLFANTPVPPAIPKGAHVTQVAVPNADVPAARGCMTILLDNAGAQLMDIEAIHAQPGQCQLKDQPARSCIPKDAVGGILSAANQSLDMALFVELYKKKDEAAK